MNLWRQEAYVRLMVLIALLAVGQQGNAETLKLKVDGLEREALVVRPAAKTKAPPVILAFHGLGGGMTSFRFQARVEKVAPDALVIYGHGIEFLGKRRGWQVRPGQVDDRDLKYVDALLNWAKSQGGDMRRVTVIGHSNGAFFSWLLSKERPGTFRAMAPLCGLDLAGAPKDKLPSLFMATGTEDNLIPTKNVIRLAEKVAGGNTTIPAKAGLTKLTASPERVLRVYDGGHGPGGDVFREAVEFLVAHSR
ncbi:MAG: dienelactone hydrolase family protein [Armatimonadetes bacterium]|nr:dienelactone hydrolase family protein [Armatimonadota bacterium]